MTAMRMSVRVEVEADWDLAAQPWHLTTKWTARGGN